MNIRGVLMAGTGTGGPLFPDMSEAYSRAYRAIALQVAAELGVTMSDISWRASVWFQSTASPALAVA